jgi:hypothetical protein
MRGCASVEIFKPTFALKVLKPPNLWWWSVLAVTDPIEPTMLDLGRSASGVSEPVKRRPGAPSS